MRKTQQWRSASLAVEGVWRATIFFSYLPSRTATVTATSSRRRKSGHPFWLSRTCDPVGKRFDLARSEQVFRFARMVRMAPERMEGVDHMRPDQPCFRDGNGRLLRSDHSLPALSVRRSPTNRRAEMVRCLRASRFLASSFSSPSLSTVRTFREEAHGQHMCHALAQQILLTEG